MRIGLIDVDSKVNNLAIMKLSQFHKLRGDTVILNPKNAGEVDHTYCSTLFTWNKPKAAALQSMFPSIEFGGTGWSLDTCLPDEIEAMKPDYDLYTVNDIAPRIRGIMTRKKRLEKATAIVNAGVGFLSRGCLRSCSWCVVPRKKGEGKWHQVANISDLINLRSNNLIILDNNFTAGEHVLEQLKEIRERGLVIDISQGIDIRTMTDDIALGLSLIKHMRSVHFAFDSAADETMVVRGIRTLSRFIKPYRQMSFCLVGFNSSFEEDMHRFRVLTDLGVAPFVMVWNKIPDVRLKHFARWVNARIYKVCPSFDDYQNWVKSRDSYFSSQQLDLAAA